jgi:hypothetical protein
MDLVTTARRVLGRLRARLSAEEAERDPIDHPDIRGMDLAQLADLPFDPYVRVRNPTVGLQERERRSSPARRARACSLSSVEIVPPSPARPSAR